MYYFDLNETLKKWLWMYALKMLNLLAPENASQPVLIALMNLAFKKTADVESWIKCSKTFGETTFNFYY